ncbi:DNA polymerase-3 subunit alpha [Afifella marina DSM 2698]|uniref:DNA polymerase III subunit alpha n=1 Tax=Afifella marina DSM 2698 TaxID=1120955 RepID=A0A1G5NJM1_AFIMA|nr:DNA polymerase III subunit alpha [Afifella marina]SCZ37633.1 DNA polymerase-3 subunit alpha [Afifella marina DSM 2698]
MAPHFIHLNCHSAFSLLEGALPVAKLIKLAKSAGMPAVGVTDSANLFGALEFSQKASGSGIQPLIGCKLPVALSENVERRAEPHFRAAGREHLFLLCANETGWQNLVHLVTAYYLGEDSAGLPLTAPLLQTYGDGLLAMTGGHDGVLYPSIFGNRPEDAAGRLTALQTIFQDRLYVAIERHGMQIETAAEAGVLELAYARDVPIVATNEPFFASEDDYESHDALLAVAEGRVVSEDDRRQLTRQHGFLSAEAMAEKFADLPEAIENTVEIAVRCQMRPKTRRPILPRFVGGTAADAETAEAHEATELREQAEAGLKMRLAKHGCAPGLSVEDYEKRLSFELGIIEKMKFPGYFLIVSDFIKWAKEHGIPVGPGRGSGAGSVVAWSLTITDLDPLRFNLLFERFLNPERVSMPDFDVDFCQERRDEVISYVQERYGKAQVAQIITFGTLQARAALRDVGRVLEMPYGQVDRLCKLVPADPSNPVTLAQAVADEPRFQEEIEREPVVGRLIDIATRLEGLYRHASTHAAGIVIGDRRLEELVPLYRDPRSNLPVTQFNMKWVEQAGLVKFDFLGLKTLTVLDKAVRLLRKRKIDCDLAALPLDDPTTFAMLARGETVGVFQLESQGMRRALVGMRADRFEDIIALVALYRPGPMDNIPTYNRRKHGEEEPDYLLPELEPTLKETYGVIIYQEQVMQIAQLLSGYSLGEADLLRRAMGKKIKAEMDAQRERFVEGAKAHGVKAADAAMVFDLVAKFASYGFNKSHAAAYALVAYQTAFLKANHPAEFLAASMTLDMGNTDKLNEFRLEAKRLGIEVLPPDINRPRTFFDVEEGAIVYALSALKGVGQHAVEHIVEARRDGPFTDLANFVARTDPRVIGRRAMECLVQAGAFDSLGLDRATVFANVGRLLRSGTEHHARQEAGVVDLFAAPTDAPELNLLPADPWMQSEKLMRELAAVGAYLSGHPLDAYSDIVRKKGGSSWKDFADKVRRLGAEAGLVASTVVRKQEKRTRSGGRIGILTLSDPSGQFEAVLYQEQLFEWRDKLEPGRSYLFRLTAEMEDETDDLRVRIVGVEPLEETAAQLSMALTVYLNDSDPVERLASRLNGPGQSQVSLVLLRRDENREIEIRLPGRYQVTPQVASAIKAVPGVVHVDLQ